MKLFGRGGNEPEDLESEGRVRKFPKKELSKEEKELDLKKNLLRPKKERKKRFEIKPWSKKERIFVLTIFVGTILFSSLLAISSREWKLPNMPRLNFPKILSDETFVIEGKKEITRQSQITIFFRESTKPLSGVYGFFVINLSDGSLYGENQNEIFEAASLNKLPVMVAMYKEAEAGNLNLSTTYSLKESDKVIGAGNLATKAIGTKVSYQELVKLMGKESDNTAFNIAKKILGEEKIIKVSKDLGIKENLILDNKTTPSEMGIFFKNFWEGSYLSEQSKKAIFSYLTDTIYEDWIAKDVPAEVMHKYGTLTHVRNDAGIVFTKKPYVLVVMSKGIVEKEADEFIPEFSQFTYRQMTEE